mmetsp:Transcript_45141/g.98648  ORF Transcript_45141/g.98648 Transcript_45141/m.98648 type:complete len:314 (+) Transcript_45141:483-1424(+)
MVRTRAADVVVAMRAGHAVVALVVGVEEPEVGRLAEPGHAPARHTVLHARVGQQVHGRVQGLPDRRVQEHRHGEHRRACLEGPAAEPEEGVRLQGDLRRHHSGHAPGEGGAAEGVAVQDRVRRLIQAHVIEGLRVVLHMAGRHHVLEAEALAEELKDSRLVEAEVLVVPVHNVLIHGTDGVHAHNADDALDRHLAAERGSEEGADECDDTHTLQGDGADAGHWETIRAKNNWLLRLERGRGGARRLPAAVRLAEGPALRGRGAGHSEGLGERVVAQRADARRGERHGERHRPGSAWSHGPPRIVSSKPQLQGA